MEVRTYDCLMQLHNAYNAREFGKLVQKLLAIAYRNAGFTHVEERGVQGVDIDAAWPQFEPPRIATEVKTTSSGKVLFNKKDVDGLKRRQTDGYVPVLAALRLRALGNWVIVPAHELQAGIYSVDVLEARNLSNLTNILIPLFEVAV